MYLFKSHPKCCARLGKSDYLSRKPENLSNGYSMKGLGRLHLPFILYRKINLAKVLYVYGCVKFVPSTFFSPFVVCVSI